MENMNEILSEVHTSLGTLREEYPGFMKAFGAFMGEVEKEGALSHKTKELISVALSVACKCKWCIAFHVKNALDAGATKDELIEACWVAALMAGGPALMYAQYVVKAIEDYQKK
jgi:AhpD family alkylhydroperoxidase